MRCVQCMQRRWAHTASFLASRLRFCSLRDLVYNIERASVSSYFTAALRECRLHTPHTSESRCWIKVQSKNSSIDQCTIVRLQGISHAHTLCVRMRLGAQLARLRCANPTCLPREHHMRMHPGPQLARVRRAKPTCLPREHHVRMRPGPQLARVPPGLALSFEKKL